MKRPKKRSRKITADDIIGEASLKGVGAVGAWIYKGNEFKYHAADGGVYVRRFWSNPKQAQAINASFLRRPPSSLRDFYGRNH